MSSNESGKREVAEKVKRKRKNRHGSKSNIDFHVQMRDDLVHSLDSKWTHPTFTGHHQVQPMNDEYAVCVVVKVFREQSAVLLDGLFDVHKLFCMNVLKRYIQIDSLYRVVNLDVAL